MIKFVSTLALILSFTSVVQAKVPPAPLTAKEASKRILAVVSAAEPLAASGVTSYKLTPVETVRDYMLQLAIEEGYSSDESDFNWNVDDASEADSTAWGETTQQDALSYLTEVEANDLELMSDSAKLKFKQNVTKLKTAFAALKGTGVLFGLAPLGAVQCGVRFAAVVVIDPHSGKAYVIAREGSGC